MTGLRDWTAMAGVSVVVNSNDPPIYVILHYENIGNYENRNRDYGRGDPLR
jgi:hypothetical protein